ncbi:MAG: membrane protein insertion efficiency factor YidD [Deltaproteobacteria bacterium]|nr:membrane protein insertion efficiency factor YidD [Deltaproteobacteria bacterium]
MQILKRNWVKLSWIKDLIYNFRYLPIGCIYLYQKIISPLIGPSCRFYPSCSTYACLAFKKYGVFKGGLLAVIRIIKCNPFHPGGYNPLT